jgi:hypothetical protein
VLTPTPDDVRKHLRSRGITVYHATYDVREPLRIVVFLEALLVQSGEAMFLARVLPGVRQVTFAPDTKAIMYVTGTAADGARRCR